MKKTIQINIGGRQFNIDEDAYHMIRNYIEALRAHFTAEGESANEIIEDIEIRIAELFQEKITPVSQAITVSDVREIITLMGQAGDIDIGQPPQEDYAEYDRRDHRRLFRDPDNYNIGGVASGLAAYFNVDPIWMRVAFILLLFVNGLGLLLYIVLWIAVPKARTTAERLQMQGMPVNLSSIKSSFRNEYRNTRSSIKRSGGDEALRVIGNIFLVFLKVFAIFIGLIFFITGSVLLFALLLLLFGQFSFFGHFNIWNGWDLPNFTGVLSGSPYYHVLIICLMIIVLIPLIVITYEGIKFIFNIKARHRILRALTLTVWFLALFLFISLAVAELSNFAVEASNNTDSAIGRKPVLYVNINDNSEKRRIANYHVFDYTFKYSKDDERLYMEPELNMVHTQNEGPSLSVTNRARIRPGDPDENFSNINYHWEVGDSAVTLDKYFNIRNEDFWIFPEVEIDLYIPNGQVIVLSEEACEMLDSYYRHRYCYDSSFVGRPVVMTPDGLTSQGISTFGTN